ncbi:MAG: GNAT family N-acetyltransferase [Bacteroidetes bacterium]|nr:GNAT family N-acetyltransferase [Bacteroidota bacterium]
MPIVCATPDDIPALTKLVNSAYRGEGGWTNESHLLDGARTNEAGIAELIREPDSIIFKYVDLEVTQAELAEKPAGCVYLHKQGNKLYLGMLSVDPTRQGGGIGKDLLDAAVVYAQEMGCVTIRITVISLRTELVAWYERHGYVRTGETEPFHAGEKFGIQKQPLELVVLERAV